MIEQFFKTYFVRLTSFAYTWVKSEDIAKDIVQDAFIAFVERQDIIEKPEAVVKSFLYSTVKNLSLNHIRNNQVRSRINLAIVDNELDETDLLARLINAEMLGELHQELSRLPESCQHICRLIYLEEMKYDEVAKELNLSLNTVKSQRQRALRILRERMLSLLPFIF